MVGMIQLPPEIWHMIIMNWNFDRTKKRLVKLLRFPDVEVYVLDIWAGLKGVRNGSWKIVWRTNTICECYRMWYTTTPVKVSHVCNRDLALCRYGHRSNIQVG